MIVTRRLRFARALAAFVLAFAAPAPAMAQSATETPLQVLQGMFDALAGGDTAGIRTRMHPAARIIQTGNRDGVPFHNVIGIDAFLASIGGAVAQGRKLEEKIFDPEVKIDDNLAQIWVRYEFHVDGQLSHCGVDSNQIIRTDKGWQIIQIVDTQRRPCQ